MSVSIKRSDKPCLRFEKFSARTESGRIVRTLTSIVQQVFQAIVELKHETRTFPCRALIHLRQVRHFLSLSILFPFIRFLFYAVQQEHASVFC